MVPRNEKIAFVVALLLSASAAWDLWVGAPQFSKIANDWALDVPGYIGPFFRYHKAFAILPVLVITAWLLPQTRKNRGWICLAIGLFSILLRVSIWIPLFMAPAVMG